MTVVEQDTVPLNGWVVLSRVATFAIDTRQPGFVNCHVLAHHSGRWRGRRNTTTEGSDRGRLIARREITDGSRFVLPFHHGGRANVRFNRFGRCARFTCSVGSGARATATGPVDDIVGMWGFQAAAVGAGLGATGFGSGVGKVSRNALNASAIRRSSSISPGLRWLIGSGMYPWAETGPLETSVRPGVEGGPLGGAPLAWPSGALSWNWVEGAAPLVASE